MHCQFTGRENEMSDGKRPTIHSKRESGIESLRLLAMFLIMFNHFPWIAQHNFAGSFANNLLSMWGGVGDCVFFMISTWFLCTEDGDMHKSFRRAWILERQLLFCSLVLFVATFAMYICQSAPYAGLGMKGMLLLGVHAFFPAITFLWWYPSNYIIFLLLYPWLIRGLRSLGQQMHQKLVVLLLISCSIYPLISDTIRYSFIFFIYIFILLSYFRWYQQELFSSQKIAGCLIAIGLVVGIFSALALSFVAPAHAAAYANNPFLFPSLFVSSGLMIIFTNIRGFHSAVINKFAASTLSCYLFITYPHVSQVITHFLNTFVQNQNLLTTLGIEVLCVIVLFVSILLIDFVRQFLFAHLLDSRGRKGKWFESIWGLGTKIASARPLP